MRLIDIAHGLSGDEGSDANVAIITRHPSHYAYLRQHLTAEWMERQFHAPVTRYEVPHLSALNFILHGVLEGGASLSLAADSQGKGLAQQVLMKEIPDVDH